MSAKRLTSSLLHWSFCNVAAIRSFGTPQIKKEHKVTARSFDEPSPVLSCYWPLLLLVDLVSVKLPSVIIVSVTRWRTLYQRTKWEYFNGNTDFFFSVLLNASQVFAALTDLGRQFHSLGALTAKEFSYKETALAGIPWTVLESVPTAWYFDIGQGKWVPQWANGQQFSFLARSQASTIFSNDGDQV